MNTKVITGVNTRVLTQFLALAGIATFLPFIIHLQWLTGPIVNAILIITLFLIGIRSALFLCVIPSLMALSGGLLPAVLAPILPFIMIGNMLMVLSVDWLYTNIKNDKKGYWLGVVTGAGLKFVWLLFSLNIVKNLLIKQELAIKVAQIFSWPQFATAITGGLIAWAVLKWLKRI
jgi:hypothetical protein